MKREGLGVPGVCLGYLEEKLRSEERLGCETSTARPYVSARPRYMLWRPSLGLRAAELTVASASRGEGDAPCPRVSVRPGVETLDVGRGQRTGIVSL